jgi:hypothetical protein
MPKTRQKTPLFFYCKSCDYKCCKYSDWDRHISTRKHFRLTQTSEKTYKKNAEYFCACGKAYHHRQSLYKHIKQNSHDKTHQLIQPTVVETMVNTQMFYELMKQNTEFQQSIMDILKQQQQQIVSNTTNNIVNSNSNNKTFNLNIYLNETCKDAMNMSEFIDSIQVQIADLETTGQLGYVEGISNIFLNNLTDLDTHMRPIHCSDLKREILYIKNDNQWTKETDEKNIIIKAIKQVTTKNIQQISEWIKLHPDCLDSESKKNDQYLQIVSNSMSGGTIEEQKSNINKIIKNLAKEVVINK